MKSLRYIVFTLFLFIPLLVFAYPQDNFTINTYSLPVEFGISSSSSRNLTLRYDDWQMYLQNGYQYGYIDICSNFLFSVDNTHTCNDGCYNNLAVVNLGTSCKIDTLSWSPNGIRYILFFNVKKFGMTNSDTLPYINDVITFNNLASYDGFIQFNSYYLTENDLYLDYARNNSTNQLLDKLDTQMRQNAQQQHQDSINEQNAINQNTQAQQETNNLINNDNVDGASSEVDSLLNNNAFNDNSGIQSIINAPLNFINGLTNSCSPITLTIPFIDTSVNLPCIKEELEQHVPLIVPILSTAINGFVIYRILLDIVSLIKSSRDPDDDRIEVLDL